MPVSVIISAVITVYAAYLLVDALRTGCAPTIPVGRYYRRSNPFKYWLATLFLATFLYACLFTLVAVWRTRG